MRKLRYFKYRYDYTRAPKINHKVPIDVSLELSSICNMNCSYCYHSDQVNLPFQKGLMDKQLAFDTIVQCADLGVNSIKFNFRGEATLHPNYEDITSLAKDLAHGSTFIDRLTNSNFKILPGKRESAFRGLANLTKVKVSYDSFIKEVFEKQRTGGDHDLTTENINLFYNHKARIKSGTELVIQAVRTKLNKDEDIAGEVKKRWPDATVSIRDMVAGRVEKDLSELENKKRSENRQSCIQAHARMIVHWDGRVGPCCPAISNDLLIGDLNKSTVSQVFNSMFAKQLRLDLKYNKTAFEKEPCKSCSSFESYQGYKAPWNS